MQFRDKYAFLSNMYACKVQYDGETFPCVETAFQYMKCANDEDKEKFITNRGYWVNGPAARQIGRRIKLRKDWEDVKMEIMYELLEQKFIHNESFREALKATGNRMIQEDNTWGDTFWGVCNGVGQNMLGKMIMEIRQTIQDNDKQEKKVIVMYDKEFTNEAFMCKMLDFYLSNVKPLFISEFSFIDYSLIKKYANEHKAKIVYYPAKKTGYDFIYEQYKRNAFIAGKADYLIVFTKGNSANINHMIEVMKELGKPVKIVDYKV